MTEKEKTLLKQTVCQGASPQELDVFIAVCERTGLDPHARQVYFIKRGGRGTTQVSIDGLRSIAERTGEMDGLDTHWCGPDGKWVDVWLSNDPPAAARVRVYRKGCQHPFTGIAKWSEYSSSGPIWTRMPALMLAKCSSSLALRCSFPLQLSGLYTQEEMAQADAPLVREPMASSPPDGYDAYRTSILKASKTLGPEGATTAYNLGTKDLKSWLAKDTETLTAITSTNASYAQPKKRVAKKAAVKRDE
jgi:phage recombination protein Bet